MQWRLLASLGVLSGVKNTDGPEAWDPANLAHRQLHPSTSQAAWRCLIACRLSRLFEWPDFGIGYYIAHLGSMNSQHQEACNCISHAVISAIAKACIHHHLQEGLDLAEPVLSGNAGHTFN